MYVTDQLISPKYRDLQIQLHNDPRGYGGRGDKWAGIVAQIAQEYDCASVLDYGCGQGSLARALRDMSGIIRVSEYDPAIPGKDQLPGFADLVVCTDVLEHIEQDRLDAVLAHLKLLARKVIWMVVSTKGSNKRLADGRNAHLTIRPCQWWKQKFKAAGFTLRPRPTVVRFMPEKEYPLILEP